MSLKLSGVGLRHQATADGARVSSANSFLKAAVDRPNLKVLLNAQVQKVLLGGGGSNRARGILVKLRDGRTRNIFVRREVVISAGAVASPQLLMLSGIGPRRHLQELDIPGTRFNNFNLKQF
jgi:choline dehydrogenase-like flavoprotein